MQIASHTVHLPSPPHRRNARVTAVAAAAVIAAGAVAVVSGSGDDPVRVSAAPGVAAGGDVLSRYDPALLHHHGIRALRAPVEPTAAARLAADRFHHR